MAAYIVSRTDEVVEVEPQVSQMVVKIAGLTVFVRRAGSDDEPTVEVDVWGDNLGKQGTPAASIEVPAPADTCRGSQFRAVLEWYRARQ